MLLLLLASLSLGVDTTNLWANIPTSLESVSLSTLDSHSMKATSVARRTTVISFYSSLKGDGRDAQALDAVAHNLEKRKDLAILFVDIDLPRSPEERAAVGDVARDLKLKLPVYIDDQLGLLKWVNGKLLAQQGQKPASNVMWTPTFVLLRDGALVESGSADPKLDVPALAKQREREILRVLDQK